MWYVHVRRPLALPLLHNFSSFPPLPSSLQSNNSTKSRVDYVAKLQSFGIDAEAEDVVSSSFATAQYLRTALPEGSKAYVVGASGLHTELQLAGFGTLGLDDFDKSFTMKSFTPELLDPAVKAVVVGMDLKLNYFKIAMAKAYLDHAPGCKFVATNTDSTFPGENMFHPGGGVCVRAVETCTRPVDVVVGKPNTVILDIIAGACALDLSRSMMVGDRLNTDVAFGNAKGLTTLLVETGVNSAAEVRGCVRVPMSVWCRAADSCVFAAHRRTPNRKATQSALILFAAAWQMCCRFCCDLWKQSTLVTTPPSRRRHCRFPDGR